MKFKTFAADDISIAKPMFCTRILKTLRTKIQQQSEDTSAERQVKNVVEIMNFLQTLGSLMEI